MSMIDHLSNLLKNLPELLHNYALYFYGVLSELSNEPVFIENAFLIAGCAAGALICLIAQLFVKRLLPFRQYTYLRDILLMGAWLVLATWFGSLHSRVVVAGAVLAGMVGMIESIYNDSRWRLLFPVIGALCAYFGPAVHFIRFPDGEYIYLTPLFSFIAGTIWFSFFPFVFNYLDEIPGLVGHILAVTFMLMLLACFFSGAGEFFMTFAGLFLIIAFWSRYGNVYRQSGRAMSSMWAVIIAGTSIIGNSKGIVLSTVLFLSLGLFAIPMLEIFFSFVYWLFKDEPKKQSTDRFYKRMLDDGLEHPEAVQYVAGLYALTSMATFWHWGVAAIAVIILLLIRPLKAKAQSSSLKLWGIRIDNISMNYAISKAKGIISHPKDNKAHLVSTLNALGIETALKDKDFFDCVNNSEMVLADGTGLFMGMKILGMPIVERVAGIDFAEQLCRLASTEKLPVYFLGAEGDTALRAAKALKNRFPGLIIAGARDGYFNIHDRKIAQTIVSSGAKILLVAMGQPRQEKWVMKYRESLGNILAVGIGGAFDVFSGSLKRAPLWVQKIGFEWLYRLIQEPDRWKRNLGLFKFAFRIFAAKLGLYRRI